MKGLTLLQSSFDAPGPDLPPDNGMLTMILGTAIDAYKE